MFYKKVGDKSLRFLKNWVEKTPILLKTPLKKFIVIYILYQKNTDWEKWYAEKKD